MLDQEWGSEVHAKRQTLRGDHMMDHLRGRGGVQFRPFGIIILLLFLSAVAFAQNDDLRSSVDYKVNKMKKELDLSQGQIYAVKPIVKEYLVKHAAVLDEVSGQGIVDHVSIKSTLKALKEKEYHELSKVLSPDQMKKLINKDNVMASLNPDNAESTVDDGLTVGANGANFKF